jgi:hypothetical protein
MVGHVQHMTHKLQKKCVVYPSQKDMWVSKKVQHEGTEVAMSNEQLTKG